MSLELTTADKSTRAGILSALNSGIVGIPALDGLEDYYFSKSELIWTDEAVEGDGIPDGSSASFVKTYPLSRSYPNGVIVLYKPAAPTLTGLVIDLKNSKELLTCYLNTSLSGVYRNDLFSVFNDHHPAIYANQDYTQARRLFGYAGADNSYGPKDAEGNLIYDIVGPSLGKTYTELNNMLVGYYNGPFDSGISFFTSDSNTGFIVESVYLDSNNLKFLLKKVPTNNTTTDVRLTRRSMIIVSADI